MECNHCGLQLDLEQLLESILEAEKEGPLCEECLAQYHEDNSQFGVGA